LSSVSTADLWPNSRRSTLTFAPERIGRDAQVCRRSCSRTPSVGDRLCCLGERIARLPQGQVPATPRRLEHQCPAVAVGDLGLQETGDEGGHGHGARGVVLGRPLH
jgi:hypothetical protein